MLNTISKQLVRWRWLFAIMSLAAVFSLASITTIVGFLSMHFSDVTPFHDLGNRGAISAIGNDDFIQLGLDYYF